MIAGWKKRWTSLECAYTYLKRGGKTLRKPVAMGGNNAQYARGELDKLQRFMGKKVKKIFVEDRKGG